MATVASSPAFPPNVASEPAVMVVAAQPEGMGEKLAWERHGPVVTLKVAALDVTDVQGAVPLTITWYWYPFMPSVAEVTI